MRISTILNNKVRLSDCEFGQAISAHSRRGFTMIELLVVIALIALLAGLGGGIYKGTFEGVLVKKAARDFYLTARYARMLAIEQQKPFRIEISTETNTFALVEDKYDEQTGEIKKVVIQNYYVRPVVLEGDVKIEDVKVFSSLSSEEPLEQEEGRSITFFPNGTAQRSIIQIGDGRSHYTASISSSTGKVKLRFGQEEDVESHVIDLDKR